MAAEALDLHRAIHHLPKVDLHRHLEGSLRLTTLAEVVREQGLDLPADPDLLRARVQFQPGDPRTHVNFLAKFDVLRRFYLSENIIRRIAREVVEDAAADKVRYLELRFTPAALARAKGFPFAEVIRWVLESSSEAAAESGLAVRYILSVNRHEPIELAKQVAQLAVDYAGHGVVGLDLAGNEADFAADPFRSIFAGARQAGLGLTVHAGEWDGPPSVKHAIETMQAVRIGHGVRVLEDRETALMARDRGVIFEVCPTSNLQTGVVESYQRHPLPHMIQAGLQVTVNTDDPGISNIRLSDEYAAIGGHMGLSLETIKGLIMAGVQAAFLPKWEKTRLEREFQDLIPGIH